MRSGWARYGSAGKGSPTDARRAVLTARDLDVMRTPRAFRFASDEGPAPQHHTPDQGGDVSPKKKPPPNPIVADLAAGGGAPSDVYTLHGYVGDADGDVVRVYLSLHLDQWVDLPESAIVSYRDVDPNRPETGTWLRIRRDIMAKKPEASAVGPGGRLMSARSFLEGEFVSRKSGSAGAPAAASEVGAAGATPWCGHPPVATPWCGGPAATPWCGGPAATPWCGTTTEACATRWCGPPPVATRWC